MKKSLQFVGAIALTFAVGGAQATSLTDLLGGASITIGDKLFDDFQFIYEDTSDFHTVDTDNIEVTGLADNGSGYGLRFEILDDEFMVQGDDIYAYLDYSFGFHVSVLDPGYLINGVSLEGLLAGTSRDPDGFNDIGSYILESVGTASMLDDLGVLDAEHSVLDDVVFTDLGGSVNFAGRSEIWVVKNIAVWAQDSTDNAHLDGFDQRFSQVAVPVPGPLALIALGLVGLGWSRRSS
ncbi:MAG: PEP-CTERM sorting domain-containing protein [Gammaproteobacteria bacterium]|nr:PEP-CTERM sorting domain-containing protein [Gammaproteobacteria bacterium]MCP5299744.1 PEP-CTERM sorting domain-containing protein [Chromatiaceae bacterium]